MSASENTTEAWVEEIPRVADANAFVDIRAYYVAAGVCQDLRTQEQYNRAKMVVQVYPQTFRIMRHERDGYKPRIYSIGGSWVASFAFIESGADVSWEGVSVGPEGE